MPSSGIHLRRSRPNHWAISQLAMVSPTSSGTKRTSQ